MVIQ
jgi:hypothetical protein